MACPFPQKKASCSLCFVYKTLHVTVLQCSPPSTLSPKPDGISFRILHIPCSLCLSLLQALILHICCFSNTLRPSISLLLCLADLCSSFDVELKVCFFWSAEPWQPRFGLGTFLHAPDQGLAQVLGLTY